MGKDRGFLCEDSLQTAAIVSCALLQSARICAQFFYSRHLALRKLFTTSRQSLSVRLETVPALSVNVVQDTQSCLARSDVQYCSLLRSS